MHTNINTNRSIKLWDVSKGAFDTFLGHTGSIKCVKFQRGDHNVFGSASRDGKVSCVNAKHKNTKTYL